MRAEALRLPVLGLLALFLTPSALTQEEVLPEPGLDRGTETAPSAPAARDGVPEGLSAGDWAGIRAAYDAGRYDAYSIEGGFEARNPGQTWRTRFDGRGFLTKPDVGGWTWGLELERYGFAGCEREVTRPMRASAEGGRVAYAWDATLEEWYVNDARGLEHGYTVRERPLRNGQEEGPLTFTLVVRGELRPQESGDGRDVRFLDAGGAAALSYSGLSVFDADGRNLHASFERRGDRLLLSVDERAARYPISIDPIAQQAYLKASNTGARVTCSALPWQCPASRWWSGRCTRTSGSLEWVVIKATLARSTCSCVAVRDGVKRPF